MANDRIYLVSPENNLCLKLGKHMGEEWYDCPTKYDLEEFFKAIYCLSKSNGLEESLVLCLERDLPKGIGYFGALHKPA